MLATTVLENIPTKVIDVCDKLSRLAEQKVNSGLSGNDMLNDDMKAQIERYLMM